MIWSEIPKLIDPIAFSIGNFPIYWYSLSYLSAFFVVYFLLHGKLDQKKESVFSKFKKPKAELFDFLMICFLGVIVGGRLGYIIFYDLKGFFADPWAFLLPFQNGDFVGFYGMSFHGGLIGVILATVWYSKKHKIGFWDLANFVVPAIPLGYFFGRIGNFMNGELFGRPTESFIGMQFPKDELGLLRHPSQLYEALGEGILLFLIILFLQKKKAFKDHALTLFLFFYGVIRFVIEFAREPDPHLGFIFLGLTTGQILCIGMMLSGILIYYLLNKTKKDD